MNVAASDSCVPNLYADALEARTNGRAGRYNALIRSFANVAHSATDLLAAAVCTFLIYNLAPGSALSLRQQAIIGVVVGIVAAFSGVQQKEATICNLIQVRETEAILRSAILSQISFLCINLLLGRHLP